jgi:hypothetical protein
MVSTSDLCSATFTYQLYDENNRSEGRWNRPLNFKRDPRQYVGC